MTLPRTVADVLANHVMYGVECIYVQRQLGLSIASTAPLGKITDALSAVMRRFIRD